MKRPAFGDDELCALQRNTFDYFWKETNPKNGLLADNTSGDAPASIAAVGHALAAYVVGVENSYITRARAVERTLTTLRFFWNSPQGKDRDATGYKGFYYHFLDMETGRRVWQCELSTIDTVILLAGALTSAAYFDGETESEREIRKLADALYRRVDWQWAQNGGATVTHGWKPERGFLKYRWEGYNEGLILYVLGLASPTHPLPRKSYEAWTQTYRWKKLYDIEFLYAGPLFIHQLSHIWIDFRGIQDDFMRERGIDYFENSRRASYVQQQYARRNPKKFVGYGEYCWGITASNGPGTATRRIKGVTRRFYDYHARSIPYGPDDGTLAPWAVVASLPFAPEIVLPTLSNFGEKWGEMMSQYGISCSFNPTFPGDSGNHAGWVSNGHFGIDQGPVILMIENYRSGLIWRLMRRCPHIIKGLRRAGFAGGWLSS
ncbi:MAG: glucoamylase family protein [Pyrinomonadaceae bacterium]